MFHVEHQCYTWPMNARQELFVREYRKDLNGTQAAIRAGYSKKTAASQAEQLLRKRDIKAWLAVATKRQVERCELTAVRVLEEMRRLAFANVQDLFDQFGNLRPIHSLTREQAACISSIEVIIKNAAAGDGHTDIVHKVRMWDKRATLEMLGKHFALLTEHVKIEASDELVEALLAGRARAASARKPEK